MIETIVSVSAIIIILACLVMFVLGYTLGSYSRLIKELDRLEKFKEMMKELEERSEK